MIMNGSGSRCCSRPCALLRHFRVQCASAPLVENKSTRLSESQLALQTQRAHISTSSTRMVGCRKLLRVLSAFLWPQRLLFSFSLPLGRDTSRMYVYTALQ